MLKYTVIINILLFLLIILCTIVIPGLIPLLSYPYSVFRMRPPYLQGLHSVRQVVTVPSASFGHLQHHLETLRGNREDAVSVNSRLVSSAFATSQLSLNYFKYVSIPQSVRFLFCSTTTSSKPENFFFFFIAKLLILIGFWHFHRRFPMQRLQKARNNREVEASFMHPHIIGPPPTLAADEMT